MSDDRRRHKELGIEAMIIGAGLFVIFWIYKAFTEPRRIK